VKSLAALLDAISDARSSPPNGIDIQIIKKLASAVREEMIHVQHKPVTGEALKRSQRPSLEAHRKRSL
jgi:hypothetical protein